MATDPKDNTGRKLPLAVKVDRTAHELSTSISGVYGLVDAGRLTLVKLGKKSSRITGELIERLLAERAKPAADIPNLKQYRTVPDRPSGD